MSIDTRTCPACKGEGYLSTGLLCGTADGDCAGLACGACFGEVRCGQCVGQGWVCLRCDDCGEPLEDGVCVGCEDDEDEDEREAA